MSTQFYTQDQPATSQQDTGHRAPRPHRDGPSWFRIAAIIIGTVAAAALIVLAATGLTRSHPAQTPAPRPAPPSPPARRSRPPRPPRPPTRPSRRPRPSPRRRRSRRCSSSSAS